MTVSSTYTDKVYQITGTTTVFAWGQDYDSHYGSLVVTEETAATGGTVVTTYVEGTDYTISNRNVVFNTAPSDTTHYIRITRDTYRGQPVEFHEGEDFPAEDFENALDRLAMAAQEQKKNLKKETDARIAADEALDEAITNEIARAQAVEGNLSNLTTTEKTNLVAAINEVNGRVHDLISVKKSVTFDIGSTVVELDMSSNVESNITYYPVVCFNDDNSSYMSRIAIYYTTTKKLKLTRSSSSTGVTFNAYICLIPTTSTETSMKGVTNGQWTPSTYNLYYTKAETNALIPTVNNATIVFKQGGTTKGTITLNQSSDDEIDLDAGGSSSASSLYLTKTVTFAANSSTADIDVSDLVEASVGYYPVVYFQDADSETLSTRATYIVASKVVRIARDTTATASETYFPTICLIPTTSTASTVVGVTNGQWVDPTYNAYYTKLAVDTALNGKIDKTSIASSVSGTSTNNEVTGAKLFYDTCGDITTLINAL